MSDHRHVSANLGAFAQYEQLALARFIQAEPQKYGADWTSSLVWIDAASLIGLEVAHTRALVGLFEFVGVRVPTLREFVQAAQGLVGRLKSADASGDAGRLGDCKDCLFVATHNFFAGITHHMWCTPGRDRGSCGWMRSADHFLLFVDLLIASEAQLQMCQALELTSFARTKRLHVALVEFLRVYGFDRADDVLVLAEEGLLTEGALVSLVQASEALPKFCAYEDLHALLVHWREQGHGFSLHGLMRRSTPADIPQPAKAADRRVRPERTMSDALDERDQRLGKKSALVVAQVPVVAESQVPVTEPPRPSKNLSLLGAAHFESDLLRRAVELVFTHALLNKDGVWIPSVEKGEWFSATAAWSTIYEVFGEAAKSRRRELIGDAFRFLRQIRLLEFNEQSGRYRLICSQDRTNEAAMIMIYVSQFVESRRIS